MTKKSRSLLAAVAVSAVALTSGCGLTVDSLPLPEPGVEGETYLLHAEFDNALNLPDQAKVKMGGSDIGVVSGIRTEDYQAIVDMEISEAIELPAGSKAELRQATPLGDVFIAVTRPEQPAGGTLADGATLTREQTSAGATVEELLISVSMMFNGGGLASLSRLGSELGDITGGQGNNLAHLTTQLTGVVGDLHANSARIDTVLSEFNTLAGTIGTRKSELGQVADSLPQAIGVIAENNQEIGDLLTTVAEASRAIGDFSATTGQDLSGLLDGIDNLTGALAASGDNLGVLLDALHASRPGIDQTMKGKGLNPFATATMLDLPLLSSPDVSRFPNMRDVNDMVASFLQVMQVIQGRIGG